MIELLNEYSDFLAQILNTIIIGGAFITALWFRKKLWLYEKYYLYLICVSFLLVFLYKYFGFTTFPWWLKLTVRGAFIISLIEFLFRLRRRKINTETNR